MTVDSAPPVDTAPPSSEGTPPVDKSNQPPAGDPPVPAGDNQPPAGDPPAGDPPPADYKIPDAYKDKPWAAKVKSEDDLWKQLDNTQTLLGKKHVVPDFDKATPKEIEDFVAQTRPEKIDAYDFSGGQEDYTASDLDPEFGKAFQKAGIHPKIGNELIKDLKGAIEANLDKAFEPEAFITEMKAALGSEANINATRQFIEGNLSAEDKAVLDNVPNAHLAVVYRLAAKLQKAYGATETGLGGEHKTDASGKTVAETQSDLRKQIRELDKRPHDQSEKDALINRLNDTYKTQTNKR